MPTLIPHFDADGNRVDGRRRRRNEWERRMVAFEADPDLEFRYVREKPSPVTPISIREAIRQAENLEEFDVSAPIQKPARRKSVYKGSRGWRRAFLMSFAKCPSISRAARAAGVSPTTVTNARKKDPAFEAKFQEAFAVATDRILEAAWERGVEGVEETIFFQGEEVGTRIVYDSKLLEMLAKGLSPEVFDSRFKVAQIGARVIGNLAERRTEALEAAQARILQLVPGRGMLESGESDHVNYGEVIEGVIESVTAVNPDDADEDDADDDDD